MLSSLIRQKSKIFATFSIGEGQIPSPLGKGGPLAVDEVKPSPLGKGDRACTVDEVLTNPLHPYILNIICGGDLSAT